MKQNQEKYICIQDLSSFRLPHLFRGRSAFWVLFWWFVRDTIFRHSPQPLYAWRRFLLRIFGAKVGRKAILRPTVRITYPWFLEVGDYSWVGDFVEIYNLAPIKIGANVCISQKSYLCAGTHDYRVPTFDIQAFPIEIHDEAWLATDVFVGPGVSVGHGALIAARSTVLQDVPAFMKLAGTPARVIGPRIK